MDRVWSVLMAAGLLLGGGCAQTAGPAAGPGLEIRRSGGLAGFDDILTVAPDGTAQLVTKDGRRLHCRLGGEPLRRLVAVDWAAVPVAPPAPGRSDAMTFLVQAGTRRVALDADTPPAGQRPAVDAVAAAFSAVAGCPPG